MSKILLETSPQLTLYTKPTNENKNVISADLLLHEFPCTDMTVTVSCGAVAIMGVIMMCL